MKTFETVYNELENLLIKKLPEYIEKINKQYNDNLILKNLENTSLEENCIKQPCFKLTFTGGEYSEKDRIIENSIFNVSLEIKLEQYTKKTTVVFWRYVEAVKQMLNDTESDYNYSIIEENGTKIILRIVA